MTSFSDLPYDDIKFIVRGQGIDDEQYTVDDVYRIAWYLITERKVSHLPPIVEDFLIALNLYRKRKQIPNVKSSYIQDSTMDDLHELSSMLMLTKPDKQRIIRILSLLGKLINDIGLDIPYNIKELPEDIMNEITYNMRCKDVLKLCETSREMSRSCKDGIMVSVIKNKVKDEIGLNVEKYDVKSVVDICKYQSTKRFAFSEITAHVILNGDLYMTRYGQLSDHYDKKLQFYNQFHVIQSNLKLIEIAIMTNPSHGDNPMIYTLNENGNVYASGNPFGMKPTVAVNDDRFLVDLEEDQINIRGVTPIEGISNIIQITSEHERAFMLSVYGSVFYIDSDDVLTAKSINKGRMKGKIVKLASCKNFTVALLNTGKLYLVENNKPIPRFVEMRTINKVGKFKDIYGDEHAVVFIDIDNNMYAMGAVSFISGAGTPLFVLPNGNGYPSSIPTEYVFALDDYNLNPITKIENYIKVLIGQQHIFVLFEDRLSVYTYNFATLNFDVSYIDVMTNRLIDFYAYQFGFTNNILLYIIYKDKGEDQVITHHIG